MHKINCLLAYLIVAFTITGCESTMESPEISPLTTNEKGEGVISYPAEIRSAYIRNADKTVDGKQFILKYDAKGSIVGVEEIIVSFIDPVTITCAEPPPDTSVSSTAGFNASANLQLTQSLSAVTSVANTLANTVSAQASRASSNGTNSHSQADNNSESNNGSRTTSNNQQASSSSNDLVSLSGNVARTANELGGRDNIVLLSRDSYFRLCEAYANGAISRNEYGRLHVETLHQITAMVNVKKALANAVEAESKAKQADAEAKAADAKKQLVEAQKTTQNLIRENALKSCGPVLTTCNSDAAGDATKIKNCKTDYEKCILSASRI